MSWQIATHSLQMLTPGPPTNFGTWRADLLQKEQRFTGEGGLSAAEPLRFQTIRYSERPNGLRLSSARKGGMLTRFC
jgi:hypothetical protein